MTFPSFLLPWFAIGGLAAAAGPLLIHLLNRRRFRTVQWAAMDFLREAVFRSRRILQIRDLLLLMLRMACLVAFGAALARPFISRSGGAVADPDQPVHAVVLLDNSMSMGYEKLQGILLNDAKAKAKDAIERLPRGSRVSVLPTCGSSHGVRYDAYTNPEDALEAVAAIQPVDRATRPAAVLDLAMEACRRLPGMPAKKLVLVTDQQVASWPSESLADHLKQLPSPLEIIQVTPNVLENAWIADFKLRDGVADLQTPATLVATIGYQGPMARPGVQVTLSIEGVAVATQTVDLEPGQVREVQFPPYKFDVPVEPGKPSFVTAEVSIPHDRLPADDQRSLVVPVVAALPVVFVDSLGPDEDPQHDRYGETFFVRRLLAPLTNRMAQERQLVQVRHVRADQLTQDTLADARLVIVAGVANPRGLVSLLQDYVAQGGNLVIAAGGEFDPAAWTEAAWSDGLGLLPAPLKPTPVGHLPTETAGQLDPFLLDFDTLLHEYFLPEGTAEEELKAMYGPPLMFFKAVAADASDDVRNHVGEAVAKLATEQRGSLADIDRKLDAAGRPGTAAVDQAELQRQRALLRPTWLTWRNTGVADADQRTPEELAERAKPKVMGRFTNGLPFLVRRAWGNGQVVLITTGLSPEWNTLPVTRQAVWVYDRVFRSMLLDTFPNRNLTTDQAIVLPVAPAERSARFTLVDPKGQEQSLSVDALGGDRYGIALGMDNWPRQGLYRVTAARTQETRQAGLESKLWDIPIAVGAPAEESDLGSPEAGAHERSTRPTFLEATQAGAASMIEIQGADLWKWALAAVLAGLLAELGFLAWFSDGGERSA